MDQLNWNKTVSSNSPDIDGSPYLHDEFQEGVVFYDGKYEFSNLQLRYNLYNDEIEYKENNVVMAIVGQEKIDKVIINDEAFIYIKKGTLKSLSGLVKMWNKETPSVITKMGVEFLKKEPAKPYVEALPDRFERSHSKHYMLKSETEIEKITSVKKLIKYLGNYEPELTEFSKKEKISPNDINELAQLMDYYHTLE